MLRARNRELLGLLPAALLVIAGFTAIYIQAEKNAPRSSTSLTLNHASSASLTYGAIFLALTLAAHIVIRYALPHADPYLFPVVAVLASVGIVMVYRINPTLARQQAQWMVVGLALFVATILAFRKRGVGVLERYRYTIATAGIALALLPRVPGIGEQEPPPAAERGADRALVKHWRSRTGGSRGCTGRVRGAEASRALPSRVPSGPAFAARCGG